MNQTMRIIRLSLAMTAAAAWSGACQAYTLREAVGLAVLNNPEVLSKLHDYRSSEDDVRAAKANYYPTVDLNYERNRQVFDYPPNTVASQRYTTKGWTVNLNQSLFSGLQTYNQVKEQGYGSLARYFDFLQTSENIALQTTQAYADVLMYRQFVQIAKDNYALHKGILGQILQRVQSGVGRRVDLEQANGRMAEAESNLIVDNTNLLTATSRLARLIGPLPQEDMADLPSLDGALPPPQQLMQQAIGHSPAFLGALASLDAAHAEVNARRGVFSPTVSLQLSKAPTENYDGYPGTTHQSSVAIIFGINLFRGGADRAQLASASEKYNSALDQTELACRNLRQNLEQSYATLVRYRAQLSPLLQHQLSTEKARNAYRKQFDIGQRTLLDVLDSENELFSARRNYINAQIQLSVAQASVLAYSGALLDALQLKAMDDRADKDLLQHMSRQECGGGMQTPTPVDVNAIPGKLIFDPPSGSSIRMPATMSSDQAQQPDQSASKKPGWQDAAPAQDPARKNNDNAPAKTDAAPRVIIRQAP
ncbi:TolC family outer membrane protein [Chromobacterium amazonense]|uniref:TolC family outer membrane protein n=1 Tax=Chromobacterium amazonense TaxID=1382803 RepID=UPI0031F69D49